MGITTNGDVDFSKSTGAYPMDKEPQPLFVDADVDYSKSTGAYPMYDDTSGTPVERVVEHVGSDQASVQFPTPGPISSGVTSVVEAQRSDLALTADPTGESDAGYEARPSTVPVPGADGVERTADQAAVDAAASMTAASDERDGTATAATKAKSTTAAPDVQAKVVTPPAKTSARRGAQATGK
jgi:hypothetical protein